MVDDEQEVRDAISETLSESYDVLAAEDADEASRLLMQHSADVDLLLTDIRMPGMNGIELARFAQGRWPGLGVLLMSGYFPPTDISWTCLRKPFSGSRLVNAVEATLAEL